MWRGIISVISYADAEDLTRKTAESYLLIWSGVLQLAGVRSKEDLVKRRVRKHNLCILYDPFEQLCEVSLH